MRRPVTTMMVFVSLIVIGAISAKLIPLELFPEHSAPVVWINLPYEASTPDQIEEEITRPAEEALATITGIKEMRSTSRQDGAEILLFFEFGEETDIKALEAEEKLDGVKDQFPEDFERVHVGRWSSNDMPVLNIRISSKRDLSGAYDLLNRKLKRRIERIDGVSKVELQGVHQKEVRIELLADRVAAYSVDLAALSEALAQSNFSSTAGKITDGSRRFVVRPAGELRSVDEVRNLLVSENVRLRDIAVVTYDDPELDYGRHLDGEYAVGLEISKENGANAVAVVTAIREALVDLEGDPEMAGIELYFMHDTAEGITSSLRDLFEAGLIGGVLALVVLFFFLRRLAATLIVSLAVPISILVTVGALYFLGYSLNILSMMGLMLAIGMLVDNAVVVTENIHRHQHMDPDNLRASTLRGVREVTLAVTAGTLTTIIVFLPMIVAQADMVTEYLKHVAVAICVALTTSLLISLTVVPILSAHLKPPAPNRKTNVIDRLTSIYVRVLGWMIGHRKSSAAIILATLASVMVPQSVVKQEFFPDNEDENEIRLIYHLNDTYTVERVERAVDRIEAYLLGNKEDLEIKSVYTFYQSRFAMSTLILKDPADRERTAGELKEVIMENLPKITIGAPTFSWRNAGGAESVRITLSGESSERLADLSYSVEALLANVEGLKAVRSEAAVGDREVHVIVDRERARQYGFSSQQVASTVSAAMRGRNLREFRTDEGEVAMRIKRRDVDRASIDDLKNLSVRGPGAMQIKLASLADFREARGPREISRQDRTTEIGITAALDDITTGEARTRIARVMERVELPPGYGWQFGERFRRDEDSQQIMLVNLLLALALIYLVMASLFESLIHPAAIWTSIIFSIVGVFWFFLITNTVFSVMAWIGILVLIGIVVNNGIVLIDHINLLRSGGMERSEAILEAGRDRMRPILMTAATTVLGLVPLCLGTKQIGGDGPPYYPMARAIVGGLSFSTVVTLIILPSIYVMLDDLRMWSRRLARTAGSART
jgi:HAE1 family hydrophobic/amphiphilic exporter-1